jgi:hypothetical protein
MSRILWFFVSAVFCVFLTGMGSAGALPLHSDVCDGKIISKKLLAKYIIDLADNKEAQKQVFGDADRWHAIFTEEPDQFCTTQKVCRGGMSSSDCIKAVKACTTAQNDAVSAAVGFFQDVRLETGKKDPAYREDSGLFNSKSDAERMRRYFSLDKASQITCTAKKDPDPSPPSAADTSQFRVRGVAGDLYIDRSDKDAFKSTSQATLASTGDRSTNPTQTLKTKAALGYAFQINNTVANSTVAIPYISFYQSITDTFGKPQSTDPASNVAGGLLFTSEYRVAGLVNNVFGVRPQYLLNTKDHSEIGSLQLSYTPYTFFSGDIVNLNHFQPIAFSPIPLYAKVLFDLRLDAGAYAKRGNDPVQSLLNKDFVRSGSRVGFALTTDSDPNSPSLTLIMTETCLYGFAGTVRNLNIFDASLTYNFNQYVGLTGTYRNGIDEDTAIRVETWMVGFSGRF